VGDPPEAPIPPHLNHLPGFSQANRSQPPGPSSSAVTRGHKLYTQCCEGCHGDQGQGVPGRGYTTRTPPRDLRVPAFYKYGSSDRAVFRTVKFGLPGSPMGTYEGQLTDVQLWDITCYVRSLQGRSSS
jgi:cytochrome c oxidase cbb3-type subunit 3